MRFRLEYEKGSAIKYISHLDLVRVWERMLRRSTLKIQLSEGFNPHPKLSLGTVLPVGVWGKKEYLDFELAEERTEEEILGSLTGQQPPGIRILSTQRIPAGLPSLMASINAACYRIKIVEDLAYDAHLIIDELNRSQRLTVFQKNKNREVDIRPGIISLQLLAEEKRPLIEAWLSMGESSARLADLLEILSQKGISDEGIYDIWREGNYIRSGRGYLTPMDMEQGVR